MYPELFSPIRIGTLELRNRLVMPPMVLRKGAMDGSVTPEVVDHYAALEDLGLIVVEATVVSPEGRLAKEQLGIFEDRHVEGLSKVVKVIHGKGAAASIQIHHAGRNTSDENTFGLPVLGPSAFSSKRVTARELTEPDIERIISAFVSAAKRARIAGFDAVELHGAHGYLVSQFLSPLSNHRADRWGGSLPNRARFLRQIVSRILASESGLFLYCRLGVADGEQGGLRLSEGIEVAHMLKEDGLPLLHVSSGFGSPPPVAPKGSPYSNRIHLAMEVKKSVGIPVIGVGDVLDPDLAQDLLKSGAVDLVAIGRPLLVDPQWARKAREGRAEEIVRCRNCTACHRFMHPERCPAAKGLARPEGDMRPQGAPVA
jgi:NADPH2 dehydrogenase